MIELVIVIIILGILAATAVPKFVDLQGDARESAMKGVKGALEGAATLTYSRSAIDGTEKEATGLSASDWDIDTSVANTAYITESGATSGASSTCRVGYVEAVDDSSRPVITTLVTGC